MSTLTVQVNTGTDATPTWTTVDADEAEIVKRRGRGGYATFRIPNAEIADRLTLRLGRDVRLHLVRGADSVWFRGVLLEPRVVATGAGVFNLQCRVSELAEKAKHRAINSTTKYPEDLAAVTQTIFTATHDATVDESAPTTADGSATSVSVGYLASATPPGDERQIFMKFDISSLPVSDEVTVAYLKIRTVTQTVEQDAVLTAHEAESSWDESTITWNNKPAISDDVDSDTGEEERIGRTTVIEELAGHDAWMSMTDYFRGVHDGAITNNGFAIKMPDANLETFASQLVSFRSSEYSDADRRPKLIVQHQPSVLVSDVVEDLFTNFYSAVDITGIQATAEYVQMQVVRRLEGGVETEGFRFDRFDSLFTAMELLTDQVPGWEWWLDTTDGDDIVLYFEEADQGAAAVIDESDINHPFEMEPENQRVINSVVVFGPTEADDGISDALFGFAQSATSQAIYDFRQGIFSDPSLTSREHLNDRAAAILHETESEYWTLAVEVPEHRAVIPGRQVTLTLANYGIDGSNYQTAYLVQETRDTFERGYWTRSLVLREYLS